MPSVADPLADAFAELPKPASLCPLGAILRDASDTARRRIEAALTADRREVPNNWILEQLRRAGKTISKDTVSDHRRGTCRCF